MVLKNNKAPEKVDPAQSPKIETKNVFDAEISRLPPEYKDKLLSKKELFSKFTEAVNKKTNGKSVGFYITPEIVFQNNKPIPDFEKLTLHFLLDDFEKPIPNFDPRLLLAEDYSKFLVDEKSKDNYGDEVITYYFKDNKNLKFSGSSVSIVRENCFDAIYDDLKSLGNSFIFEDNRGFIGALKTIDIHRNMLLQKFEKYVVVYAGAGSWLRGEKSNDFDVFIVIDDTDVKRMPRMQVKDQLSKIIWQMSREVAMLTGIQIHIQVYLLTDFWDALKDAHPVMFTFLRDGVPFYDRGLYSAWKELLKLGKIRPSAEAIDMHMNVGTQLVERAKNMFADIFMNEIYNAVLSPSQAILMLKGYNPTTPKETVRMFKEVLLEKEQSITKKDFETLERTIKLFKEIEHKKDTKVDGKMLDSFISDAEEYLKNIKKMFEKISEDRNKDSVIGLYNEFVNQVKLFAGYGEITEKKLFTKFEEEFVDSGKLPLFVKSSLKSLVKAKSDYDSNQLNATEVNKILKESRNLLSEIKSLRERSLISEFNTHKVVLKYDSNKAIELLNFENKIYLNNIQAGKVYVLEKKKFVESDCVFQELLIPEKLSSLSLSEELICAVKELLNVKEILF